MGPKACEHLAPLLLLQIILPSEEPLRLAYVCGGNGPLSAGRVQGAYAVSKQPRLRRGRAAFTPSRRALTKFKVIK